MQIFLDTANLSEIERANRTGFLDGVTTNPTLIAREPLKFEDQIRKISSIVNGPICVEVTSLQSEKMVSEAEHLMKLTKKVLIKIPVGEEGFKAINGLSKKNIPTVATLCFSVVQALLGAKAGATYIAPFIGRMDDIGTEGMELVEEIKKIYDRYNFSTKIIVASVRSPLHVKKAAMLGADVVTMPFKVFHMLTKHPLTDIGLEKFMADWDKFKNTL